jgi:predicted O-linked N-acetylglucosamine transferase (SPINDLY family)
MSEALLRQAMQLHQAGRLAEAEPLYAQVLAADARSYPALHLMGLLRLQQGRAGEALELMHRALAVKPGAPETLVNLGLALAGLNRLAEAETALRQALTGGNMPARGNLGAVLLKLGRAAEALAILDDALAASPDDPGARTNRGLALKALGRAEDALADFDLVLARHPDLPEALEGRGAVLLDLQRPAEALAACDRLLALASDHLGGHAGALGNRGTALWRLNRVEEALADYDAALAAAPASPPADILANRANLLWTRRQALEPALADLTRAVALAPERADLKGDLLHLKMHAGDWTGFAAAKAALDDGVRAGQAVVAPFVYQGLSDNPADLRACAETAARAFPPQKPLHGGGRRATGRIRVGYVSGEFRAQATSYLAAGLYEAHDRSRFEVIGIDNTRPEQSPMRTRLESAFDRMIPIAGLSDSEAASAVAAAGIDILVNLNGWFGAHRLGVFAHRPAPLQVNYLGFPGTLGAPCMDYILADGVVIPEGEERFFTERVLRLPHSYQINDDRRGDPAPAPSRQSLGLPQEDFVFAHFNYPYKLTPSLFASWLRLLAAVPGSVLWLLEASPLFARNLRAAAQGAGVDPARLVFAPVLPHEQHMARIAAADLFLDSLPYGAHTTGSDALWAGLPLLTCRGRSFAGRVGASLLTALEMPELIAEDLAAYEARALELAREPAQLAGLRAKLAEKRKTAPLFDTARTTRDIEAAYQTMFDNRLR